MCALLCIVVFLNLSVFIYLGAAGVIYSLFNG